MDYTKKPIFIVSLLAISFTLMLRMTISPVLAEMAGVYPEQSMTALLNMVSITSLTAIPAAIVSGILAKKYSKKKLVLWGLALYALGGLGPMVVSDFTVIVVLRGVAGVGLGLIMPMATGLLSDFYSGESRNRMLGFQNASVAIGNIATSLLAGFLAVISWRLSFSIYFFVALAFLLVLFFVPEPERKQYEGKDQKTVNAPVLFVCLAMFCFAVIYFTFFGYLSFVVVERGFGNAATAGLIQTSMTCGSLVIGLFFVFYTRLTKRFNVVVSLLLNAIGYGLLAYSTNVAMAFAGAICIGLGFGTMMPTSMMLVSDKAPKSAVTFANGLLMSMISLGTAVSPAIFSLISTDGLYIYKLSSIALFIAAVIGVFIAILKPKKADVKAAEV